MTNAIFRLSAAQALKNLIFTESETNLFVLLRTKPIVLRNT